MKAWLAGAAVGLVLLLPRPASADRETADGLLRDAKTAAARGRADEALRYYNAAVDEDPGHPYARLARGEFLLGTISATPDADARKTSAATAAADFEAIIRADGESEMAALARDRLAMLTGRVVFKPRGTACDSRAVQANRIAYQYFMAQRYAEAAAAYRRATDACPDDATLWTFYGNTLFAAGDLDRAEDLLKQALRLDPWHPLANRFYTTVWMRRGQPAKAYEQAVRTVIADPTYEFGWYALKEWTRQLGGRWHRVRDERPASLRDAPGGPWFALGVADLAYANRSDASPDPLVRLRHVVRDALVTTREIVDTRGTPAPPELLALEAARDAGFLDEAILVQFIDAALAPAYVEHRRLHADRMVEFVTRFVAPLSPPAAPHD